MLFVYFYNYFYGFEPKSELELLLFDSVVVVIPVGITGTVPSPRTSLSCSWWPPERMRLMASLCDMNWESLISQS